MNDTERELSPACIVCKNNFERKTKMNSKYAAAAGTNAVSTSGDDEYERDAVLKWRPHATFRGVLDVVRAGDNQWGQSIGIKFNDGKVVDGVVMARLDRDSGERDGTIKLFSWEQMPVVLDENLTADDAPPVFTEELVGKTYRYELIGARVEGDEETGRTSDPEEPVPFGDLMLWEDGGKKPSASAKIFAQLLTTVGRDAIVDKNDINNWLAVNDIEAREDLIGRELDVFKYVKQGDEYEFHCPVVTDVKTGKVIMIGKKSTASAPAPADAEPAPETPEGDTSGAPSSEMPEPVADFVEFCKDFGLDNKEQILDNLNEMADESDNSLTPGMVDSVGADNIVNAIIS